MPQKAWKYNCYDKPFQRDPNERGARARIPAKSTKIELRVSHHGFTRYTYISQIGEIRIFVLVDLLLRKEPHPNGFVVGRRGVTAAHVFVRSVDKMLPELRFREFELSVSSRCKFSHHLDEHLRVVQLYPFPFPQSGDKHFGFVDERTVFSADFVMSPSDVLAIRVDADAAFLPQPQLPLVVFCAAFVVERQNNELANRRRSKLLLLTHE